MKRKRASLAVPVVALWATSWAGLALARGGTQFETYQSDKVERSTVPVSATRAAAPASETTAQQPELIFREDSFVAPAAWKVDGTILAQKEAKIMMATGDVVYLDVGKNQSAKPGMRFGIFRKGKPVEDSRNGQFLGNVTRKIGVIELNDVQDRASTGTIISAREPIRIGDLIKAEPPPE